MRILVDSAEIAITDEIEWLSRPPYTDGALCTFIGKVRDNQEQTEALELEHYPGMTENALQQFAQQAAQRWAINRITIIHRVGRIELGENIVFVGVTSAHRAEAFAACEYLMDYLKTKAPFWKKAMTKAGDNWVEAKESDVHRAQRWQK
ncbi:MAG: molybdopterin synthase catalytic subunit MoaE [Aestuariibacter sp.]